MVGEKKWVPYLLLAPWIIGFVLFKIYPFIYSLILSFYKTNNKYGTVSFVGWQNFIDLFTHETIAPKFLNSLKVTFIYVAITVPLILIVSLFIAYICSKNIKNIGFFRTAYYMPTVLGANVGVVFIWKYIFSQYGLINIFLETLHINPVNWLNSPAGAMTAIISLRLWQFGSTMVIFLAALKNVPEELYEAARIDGASRWKQFVSITLPMITPIILFNFVMRIIDCFQVFNGPMLITGGGPNYSTYMLNVYIYEVAFQQFNLNLGSAMSWILFVIIMVFTIMIFRSSKYWVFYED